MESPPDDEMEEAIVVDNRAMGRSNVSAESGVVKSGEGDDVDLVSDGPGSHRINFVCLDEDAPPPPVNERFRREIGAQNEQESPPCVYKNCGRFMTSLRKGKRTDSGALV